jgi:hypothetical protein
VLRNRFPWRWILGKQLVMEHVSWNMKMKAVEVESWKPTRRCGITRPFLGNGYAI